MDLFRRVAKVHRQQQPFGLNKLKIPPSAGFFLWLVQGPFMVGRVCVPVPIVAGMTRVLKIQELEFMRNAMDSRLRRYDVFFVLCTLISLMLKNIFTGLPCKLNVCSQ